VRQGFDVATAAKQYEGRSLGHAYTFVRLRLMGDRVIPIIPVFINCYCPPNQPSPDRCFQFGKALRRAIDEWQQDRRIAVVASGGLTHFVIDEAIDRQVPRGIREKRSDLLRSLPEDKLNSGS
jgi:3-O-methylgallate 3,4-dioxygenase